MTREGNDEDSFEKGHFEGPLRGTEVYPQALETKVDTWLNPAKHWNHWVWCHIAEGNAGQDYF